MLCRYLHPSSETIEEVELSGAHELEQLMNDAAANSTDRGVPVIELVGPDGSALVIGQTVQGIVLLWLDALGSSFHSVGSSNNEGVVLIDYLGSYTEVPAEFVVPSARGKASAEAYLNSGTPFVSGLNLEPD